MLLRSCVFLSLVHTLFSNRTIISPSLVGHRLSTSNVQYPFSVSIDDKVNQLNITDADLMFVIENQLKYCPYVPLCNISSLYSYGYESCCKKCQCTSDCSKKGTCCPDMLVNNFKIRETCVRPQLKPFNFKGRNVQYSYFMTNKCSGKIVNETERVLCEKVPRFPNTLQSFIQHIPVTSVATNVTFKNKYCAICNGESEDNIVLWKSEVSCPTGLSVFPNSILAILKFLSNEKICNIHFFPSGTKYPLICNWGEFTQCNQTGEMDYYDPRLEYGCQSFTSFYREFYRNVLCYMCNHKQEPRTSHCYPDHPIDGLDTTSFAALLDYHILDNEIEKPDVSRSINDYAPCLANQRYDGFKNVCRSILCSPGFAYSNGKCNSIYATQSIRSYEVYLRMESDENCLVDLQCVSNEIKSLVLTKFHSLSLNGDLCQIHVSAALENTTLYQNNSVKVKYLLIHLEFGIRQHHNIVHVIGNISTFENHTIVIDNTVCNLTNSMECHFTIDDKTYGNFSAIGPLERRYTEQDTGLNLQPTVAESFFCIPVVRLERIMKNHLSPRISLSKTDFNFVYNQTVICIEETDICFKNGQYKNDLNNVIVCSDLYYSQISAVLNASKTDNPKQPKSKRCSTSLDNAQNLVSLVFASVSVFCLLIVLIVYCSFRELRTTPGINNMALTTNLLIAQLLFQFGSGQRHLELGCKIIGVFIHFFWLSSLFWMNACTIHMFRVFAQFKKRFPNTSENNEAEVVKYSIYTYGVSACFVLVNIIIRLVLTGGNDVGYGGCVCYISTASMVGFTFALPVALVISANLFLFIFVIFSIQKMPKVQSSANKKRKTFIIYIKLSCLTGISWIFGFIYQWTLLEPLAYIFIVLNAGQGIYIMFAFVCNRRVMNMLKTSCNNCTGRRSKEDNSASSNSNGKHSVSPNTMTSIMSSGSKENTSVYNLENTREQSKETFVNNTKL